MLFIYVWYGFSTSNTMIYKYFQFYSKFKRKLLYEKLSSAPQWAKKEFISTAQKYFLKNERINGLIVPKDWEKLCCDKQTIDMRVILRGFYLFPVTLTIKENGLIFVLSTRKTARLDRKPYYQIVTRQGRESPGTGNVYKLHKSLNIRLRAYRLRAER